MEALQWWSTTRQGAGRELSGPLRATSDEIDESPARPAVHSSSALAFLPRRRWRQVSSTQVGALWKVPTHQLDSSVWNSGAGRKRGPLSVTAPDPTSAGRPAPQFSDELAPIVQIHHPAECDALSWKGGRYSDKRAHGHAISGCVVADPVSDVWSPRPPDPEPGLTRRVRPNLAESAESDLKAARTHQHIRYLVRADGCLSGPFWRATTRAEGVICQDCVQRPVILEGRTIRRRAVSSSAHCGSRSLEVGVVSCWTQGSATVSPSLGRALRDIRPRRSGSLQAIRTG